MEAQSTSGHVCYGVNTCRRAMLHREGEAQSGLVSETKGGGKILRKGGIETERVGEGMGKRDRKRERERERESMDGSDSVSEGQ